VLQKCDAERFNLRKLNSVKSFSTEVQISDSR